MTLKAFTSLQPGDTIGILGGGQLGRMLAMAASRLGFRTIVLEPRANCPAAQLANHVLVADYGDEKALQSLAEHCNVITYEFENIPASSISFLEDNNFLFPSSLALEKSQDRLVEKQFLNDLGLKTAPYEAVGSLEALQKAAGKIPDGGILKTRRFGYDGKGQVRLGANTSKEYLTQAWTAVGENPSILEGFVDFTLEISVIAARDRNGRIVSYEPARNEHRQGILRTSTVPARIDNEVLQEARSIGERILDRLNYIGVMGIEFFVLADGTLLVNEIAPRVHNSGHWSEAACDISQFEQHIRAVAGLPLAQPYRHSDCVMENLIGDDMDKLPVLLKSGKNIIHLYGKTENRPGRKMGHITRLTGPAKK